MKESKDSPGHRSLDGRSFHSRGQAAERPFAIDTGMGFSSPQTLPQPPSLYRLTSPLLVCL